MSDGTLARSFGKVFNEVAAEYAGAACHTHERCAALRCGERRASAEGLSSCALAASCLLAVALGGCGSQTGSASAAKRAQRAAIERYMGEVEPIRLAVNKLLGGADPILEAFHDRGIAPGEAARRMGRLERRFAAYVVDIVAVEPPTAQLRALNAGYANTYIFEDAYLSALVVGLADGELTDLPNTQAVQRVAIIRWRVGLTVLARAADARLPADLQQAGRGEIAPSPNGS